MEKAVLEAIHDLLMSRRVLALAVVVDGDPEAGLLPFALREDYGAVYVQASALARHTRGLHAGARVGILVHAHDAPDDDPMQVPRLMLQATTQLLDKKGDHFAWASALLTARFPDAETTLGLDDFNLYELTFGRGRYVEGFGRAFNVGPETFKELAAL
jgi:heme iron utilization protein